MARMTAEQIAASLAERIGAQPAAEGPADLTAEIGAIAIAATAKDIKPGIDRIKVIPDGYRWLAIHQQDLFTASPATIGSKVGLIDPTGKVLKQADKPRKK